MLLSNKAWCQICKAKQKFQHIVQYNFGDSNLGVQSEEWQCAFCDSKTTTPPVDP
jgi:hypothetical protein